MKLFQEQPQGVFPLLGFSLMVKHCPLGFIFFPFRRWRLLAILSLVTGLVSIGFAQSSVQFEHISVEHPLSNNAVYCITQDHHGFIWIGTEDGLNRFDGHEMVVFRHNPAAPGSISFNWLRSVHEDKQGRIWVGHDNGLDLLDPMTGQFEGIGDFRLGDTVNKLDLVNRFYENPEGGMWLGGIQIIYFDPASKAFTLYPIATLESKQPEIQFLSGNGQGSLLAGNFDGLFQIDPKAKKFRPFVEAEALAGVSVRGGHFDQKGNLWIVGLEDLLRLNTTDQQLDTVAVGLFSQVGYLAARDIVEEENGRIWIGGTTMGLLRIDPGSDRIYTYQHDPDNINSIASGIGTTLFMDREGSLWIGGVNGLDRLPANFLNRPEDDTGSPQFHHLQVVSGAMASSDQKMVRCFLEDQRGDFWIGTYDGLYKYRQNGRELELIDHYTHDPSTAGTLSGKDIRVLLEDQRGDIWVSTRQGLNRIDGQSGKIERIFFDNFELNGLSEEVFWALCEDDQGRIWIGTEKSGLLRLDPISRETRRYLYHPERTFYSENSVVEILQDRKGRIWAGTYGGGLNLYDSAADSFLNFMPGESDTTSIAGDMVWTIFEDDQDRLWIGTQNGLNQLITENKKETISYRFEHYSEKDGLINNTIYGIMQDASGRLWISTINGLSCFDPAAKTFFNLGQADGLPVNSFTPDGHYKDSQTGEFLLGSINGYVRFQPMSFQSDTVAPPVIISSITRYNKQENEGNAVVDYFAAGKTALRFSYLDDIIIFNLALLNFKDNAKNQYMYRLEGLQSSWVPLGTDRKITFTDLNAGEYILHIKGANHHGVWTKQKTRIALTVVPPWWWTRLAKVIYLLLGVGAIIVIYRYQLKKNLLEQETRQLKKLDEVKSRFFTNISHEFRTPLTIISGMVTQVKKDPDQWLDKGMELIQRNSSQLLSLINQILDLRKLESGTLRVNQVQGNIIPYLQYIVDSFVPMAQAKGVRIHLLSALTELEMDYDPDKMLRILSNLLSNAIKFTPGPGDIYLQIGHRSDAGQDRLMIQVKDTGKGISAEALPYIFDPFYQIEDLAMQKPQGSGVGLALTKELVVLLGGSISADSAPGAGTTFTVTLPINRNAPVQHVTFNPLAKESSFAHAHGIAVPEVSQAEWPAAENAPTPETEEPTATAVSLPTLLIVEDNPDVRVYLSACLRSYYQLLTAENGQEGIDRAIEEVPDLIVSDVMMPVKDGFALCDTLKNDERTSHIPIVLLTARADFESRIMGLRKGADVYLAKPFEQEELLVRLEQLLALRKRLQERYHSGSFTEIPVSASDAPQMEPEAIEMEDAFIQKFRQLVLDHITEEDFGVTHFCRGLGVSRTQLHNKINALTGLSTTAFVRSIRLHKARELLRATDLNVSEVGYEVGFGNPTYFSRIYAETFGEAPSRTRKS